MRVKIITIVKTRSAATKGTITAVIIILTMMKVIIVIVIMIILTL